MSQTKQSLKKEFHAQIATLLTQFKALGTIKTQHISAAANVLNELSENKNFMQMTEKEIMDFANAGWNIDREDVRFSTIAFMKSGIKAGNLTDDIFILKLVDKAIKNKEAHSEEKPGDSNTDSFSTLKSAGELLNLAIEQNIIVSQPAMNSRIEKIIKTNAISLDLTMDLVGSASDNAKNSTSPKDKSDLLNLIEAALNLVIKNHSLTEHATHLVKIAINKELSENIDDMIIRLYENTMEETEDNNYDYATKLIKSLIRKNILKDKNTILTLASIGAKGLEMEDYMYSNGIIFTAKEENIIEDKDIIEFILSSLQIVDKGPINPRIKSVSDAIRDTYLIPLLDHEKNTIDRPLYNITKAAFETNNLAIAAAALRALQIHLEQGNLQDYAEIKELIQKNIGKNSSSEAKELALTINRQIEEQSLNNVVLALNNLDKLDPIMP